MKKTTFEIAGFWFYVTWSEDGKQGVDQRGQKWYDIHKPRTDTGVTESICKSTADAIKLSATKFIRI
jgi:hypothetical protein